MENRSFVNYLKKAINGDEDSINNNYIRIWRFNKKI